MKVRQGSVLYLSLEESEDQLRKRIEQMLNSGVPLAKNFEYATTWARGIDGVTALENQYLPLPSLRANTGKQDGSRAIWGNRSRELC